MVEHDFNIASRMEAKPPAGGMAWFPNHTWCEVYRAAATDAQKRISELEAQLKGWNKAFQSTDPAIAAERMQNAIDFAKFVGYEDARARYDAKLKAAREALRKVKCSCRYRDIWKCPQCSEELVPVSAPGWMNSDQWDAVKAGDFMCNSCSDTETKTGKKYWFDSDLSKELIGQCERCKALAALDGEVR